MGMIWYCYVYAIGVGLVGRSSHTQSSVVIVLTLPHPRVQHLLIERVRVVVVHPVVDALSLSQPLLVVLIKFALFYALVELDIVSFPQNGQDLVVDVSHSLVWVFDQFQDAHKHFSLV